MAMAKAKATEAAVLVPKYVLESTRAASLASHCAAGLTAGMHKEATRLLRMAEASCRSALALLLAQNHSKAADAQPIVRNRAARNRRKKKMDAATRERTPHRRTSAGSKTSWKFEVGVRAHIHGLSANPHLNGQVVDVLHWIAESSRFHCRLPSGQTGALSPSDLVEPVPDTAKDSG